MPDDSRQESMECAKLRPSPRGCSTQGFFGSMWARFSNAREYSVGVFRFGDEHVWPTFDTHLSHRRTAILAEVRSKGRPAPRSRERAILGTMIDVWTYDDLETAILIDVGDDQPFFLDARSERSVFARVPSDPFRVCRCRVQAYSNRQSPRRARSCHLHQHPRTRDRARGRAGRHRSSCVSRVPRDPRSP